MQSARLPGCPDTIEAARNPISPAYLGEDANDGRLTAYLATGPSVLEYLEKEPASIFVPPMVHPDYHALPGAAVGGGR